jgi:hypothetical protein
MVDFSGMLTATTVYELIMAAAVRQFATAEEKPDIVAAGLEEKVMALIQKIAANCANPIENLHEDSIDKL